MWTKNNKFLCDHCGKFAKNYDSYTPYGCSNPESPEPYDPTEFCEPCSKKEELDRIESFKNGGTYGDWMKSQAERNAAKIMGLEWDDRNFRYVKQQITNPKPDNG